ncbi:hypothetical protein SG34_011195 [Thalassomonas viridans]|uniref:DUF4350 domain-containing protein n=1 Tax=Thalassomonas viridans TaxID=137584 RepID=A0AAF0CBG0_9GAMM|nr:hypothetical protein [Thalassomonas viridans]WDE07396.1 hypothetical protein SG34_011195 [Thalassomonas viridans]
MTLKLAGLVLFTSFIFTAQAKKVVTDAIADLDYRHQFETLNQKHQTRVLIDRYHQTIYKTEDDSHGAHAMLDIMSRDGFLVSYTNKALDLAKNDTDILIIHGLPNDKITLDSGAVFWKSPISDNELESVVRWVADGGSLFLTLSHFPGGSGARPLLEAFDVKFRDGYAYSPKHPSFTSKDDRCSNFFGMTEQEGLLKKSHPLYGMGPEVEKIDFHCGAAVFRRPQDVVIAYPKDTANYNKDNSFHEVSDYYAAMIAFEYGKGKVVVTTDQGMFRNFIFTFDEKEKVYVTITSPDNSNGNLFVNMMRWLSPKINRHAGTKETAAYQHNN